jgi:hypothetical protein
MSGDRGDEGEVHAFIMHCIWVEFQLFDTHDLHSSGLLQR